MARFQVNGRIAVTGASGFVGRHLLHSLRVRFPHATLVAGVRHGNLTHAQAVEADELVPYELGRPENVRSFLELTRPDALVHLAAQSSVGASFADPVESWAANLMGTVSLAEGVRELFPDCRFVMASSAEVYGLSFQAGIPLDETAALRPANPYAASKAAADIALGEMALRGLDTLRIRAFNHIGAGQSDAFAVGSFARQVAMIEAGRTESVIRTGSLDRWRDFLDVRDVCSAYCLALGADVPPGAVFNIASGVPRTIGSVLSDLTGRLSSPPRIEVDAGRLRPTDVERVVGNSGLARRVLGWLPVIPWETTLDDVYGDWQARTAGHLQTESS